MTIQYRYCDSPLGKLLIARNETGLTGLWFEGQKYYSEPESDWQQVKDDALLNRTAVSYTHLTLPTTPYV